MTLGTLLWWKVGTVDLDHDDLDLALRGTGITPPARPLPIDVFRRITGDSLRYRTEDDSLVLEFTVRPVESTSDRMVVRHIVGELRSTSGVTQDIRKVGDLAFYKPPRGKNSKARMRVGLSLDVPPDWAPIVNAFVTKLREEYDAGVRGALDAQAIRRLVRGHLTEVGALYLDGPYYLQDAAVTEAALRALFDRLGEDSFLHSIPMPDDTAQRAFLARGVRRLIAAGGEVDDSMRSRLEET